LVIKKTAYELCKNVRLLYNKGIKYSQLQNGVAYKKELVHLLQKKFLTKNKFFRILM